MWDINELMRRVVALAEEVDLSQDTKMREEDRAQAAQHVRAYLPQFRKAGVVVSFRGTKGRRVEFGEEKASFLLFHTKERPSVCDAAKLLERGQLKGAPLFGAFLVWPLDGDESEEDILLAMEAFEDFGKDLLDEESLPDDEEEAP